MEKIGTVLRTMGERATVQVGYQSSTDCKVCPIGYLCALNRCELFEFEALNPQGAKVGDRVRIELGTAKSLAAYGLAYGVPMIGLIVGAIVGAAIAGYYDGYETPIVAAFTLLGTGAGFAITLLKGRKFKATPVITAVLRPAEKS